MDQKEATGDLEERHCGDRNISRVLRGQKIWRNPGFPLLNFRKHRVFFRLVVDRVKTRLATECI